MKMLSFLQFVLWFIFRSSKEQKLWLKSFVNVMGVTVSIENGILTAKTENVQCAETNTHEPGVIKLSSVDAIIRVLQKLDDACLESIPVHPDTDDKVSWREGYKLLDLKARFFVFSCF